MALLAAVQDRLIPHEGALPAAGESGAAQRVDGYLAERPSWRPELLAALRAIEVLAASGAERAEGFVGLAEEEQERVLHAVEAAEPRAFRWLMRLTYMAYYTDDSVQRAHGYAEAPPLPGGFTMSAFDEARLEPIKRRGKLWRDA
jgi:hypothetical protein